MRNYLPRVDWMVGTGLVVVAILSVFYGSAELISRRIFLRTILSEDHILLFCRCARHFEEQLQKRRHIFCFLCNML